MAARWVYRARYFNTGRGPARTAAWRTRPIRCGPSRRGGGGTAPGRASAASRPGKRSRPRWKAARSPARNLPRNTRLRTRTGRKKSSRPATQRLPSGESPPPVTTQWTCGCSARFWPQVCSTASTPTSAPRCFGSAATSRQGLRGGPQEQAVDRARVVQRHRAEGAREREDDVEVRRLEQVGGLGLQPPRRGRGLALGAVAVAARVVRDLLVPALRALQDMPAQGRRAAGRQVVQGATLLGRQARTVPFAGTRRDSSGSTSATSSRGRVMAGPRLREGRRAHRAGCGSTSARPW